MAAVAFAFAALGLYALAAESLEMLAIKGWLYLWFAYLAWLLFWNPSVEVSDFGIVVDNIFRKTKLNWSAIARVDTKYSLSLEIPGRVIRAWAAPAPSRYAGFLASKGDTRSLPESTYVGDRMVRPGDLPSSDSGVAALIIRRHWESLRDRGQLNEAAVTEDRFILWRLIALIGLTVAGVIGFIS